MKKIVFYSLTLLLLAALLVSNPNGSRAQSGTPKDHINQDLSVAKEEERKTAQQESSRAQPVIVIWKVGSPYEGDTPEKVVPLDLQIEAKKAGYLLTMETFPAQGFTQKFFDAVLNNTAPDILAFDNYGIMDGTTTKLGSFAGIGSSQKVRSALVQVSESFRAIESGRGGWEYLLSTSRNHQAAKTLALRDPDCEPDAMKNEKHLQANEIASIKLAAVAATQAYLGCDPTRLRAISDPARLGTGCLFEEQESHVLKTQVCGVSGNNRLVFVKTISSFEVVGRQLGRKSVLAILKNEGSGWRLLTITDDRLVLTREGAKISALTRLLTNEGGTSAPAPATLVTKEGTRPVPEAGQRFGDFLWRPSQSPEVIGEVVEFEYGQGTRLLFYPKSPGSQGRVSEGQLFTTHSLWHWRVWSVARNGAVALSEVRSFTH